MDSSDSDLRRNSTVHHLHYCPNHHHHHHHHHHICRHHHHHSHHLHFDPHHHRLCHHHHHSIAGAQLPETDNTMFIPTKIESTLHQSTADPSDEVLTQQEGVDEEGEDMYLDDPVFVMTDEWKEFFAKSEARRRLEKQQMKIKGRK